MLPVNWQCFSSVSSDHSRWGRQFTNWVHLLLQWISIFCDNWLNSTVH